ncbi:hypothetical protein [Tropicibacter alexandrii]|uniref:hypothetical protein n=1 Tax=Tropicibacter alexandrii TaxID=2267683 RepID=UPI000EF47EC4|nr:hypothetical protein [Tropicibacter alexandrii]
MTRALALRGYQFWLCATLVALSCYLFAVAPPSGLEISLGLLPSLVPTLVAAIACLLAVEKVLRLVGLPHARNVALASVAALALLPGLALRPAAQAEARALQTQDIPPIVQRPAAQIALVDGSTGCGSGCRMLLEAGAYAVFVPDSRAEVSTLAQDMPGRSFRLGVCGETACLTERPATLSETDIALWTRLEQADGDWTRRSLRTSVLRQAEGEWQVTAQDTAVEYRQPGLPILTRSDPASLMPDLLTRTAWLPGRLGLDQVDRVSGAFDLRPQLARLTAQDAGDTPDG